MLDLKAKLLAAGLVTKDQVDKVEEEERARADRHAGGRGKHRGAGRGDGPDPAASAAAEAERWRKRVLALASAPKAEQYDAIRGWVERLRLDQAKGLSETAARFHYAKSDGAISWISVEPDVAAKLGAGEAGIVAFMSNNGLAHAVVPADVARDVAVIRPDWLRVLHGVTDVEAPAAAAPADAAAPAAPAPDAPPSDPPPGSGEPAA